MRSILGKRVLDSASVLMGIVGLISAGLAATFSSRAVAQGYRLADRGSTFTVELTCGQNVSLSNRASVVLGEKALELLQSSEVNSHSPDWRFPISEVHEEFRGALSNEHLRIVFFETQAVASVGGSLRVREIIVRLGREERHTPFPDRFVDSLFTVDDKGKVVGHALYSGERFIELWRAIRDETGGPAGCRLPKVLNAIRRGCSALQLSR